MFLLVSREREKKDYNFVAPLPCRCNCVLSIGKCWECSRISKCWISRLTLLSELTILFIRKVGTILIRKYFVTKKNISPQAKKYVIEQIPLPSY